MLFPCVLKVWQNAKDFFDQKVNPCKFLELHLKPNEHYHSALARLGKQLYCFEQVNYLVPDQDIHHKL